MIGRLSGTLLEKHPPGVLVDVGGVGYELDVPMSTFYDLPATGAPVSLLVQMVVRDDALLLFGFLQTAERDAFRQLIRIAGVGARTALAVLSGLSVDELARSVALQDATRLRKVPGIGKKTAERLLLELEGKLGPATAVSADPGAAASDPGTDMLQALLALGYSEREASAAIARLPAGIAVAEGIRQALKLLVR